MQHVRTLAPSQFHLLAIASILAIAVAALTLWPRSAASSSLDPRCDSWDVNASAALAAMIHARSEIAEAQLGDALFRLRPARKHCRNGFIALARLDYDALLGDRYKFRR